MTGRWHLIGGIEVLSRGSMQLYADKRHVCEDQAEQYPTEDDYIEYCMRGKRDDLSKEARSTALPLCQRIALFLINIQSLTHTCRLCGSP